jgi:hypothetical protein
MTAASVSFVGYLLAGALGYFTESSLALVAMPVTLVLMIVTLTVIRSLNSGKR